MITTINNKHNKLNVPNKREQNQTCLDSAEREGLRPKGNVPNLRFPEFVGEWHSFLINEICSEFKSGKNIKADSISENGEYPVFGGNGLRGYTASYNHEGLYVLIGRQGALCGNVHSVNGKTYITEHAIAAAGNEKSDTSFLHYLFIKMNLGQYSDQSAQPGLAVNNLLKLKVLLPPISEQKKIAKLLSLLDERIATQNKIIDKLQSLIKGLNDFLYTQYGGEVLTSFAELGTSYSGLSGKSAQDFGSGKPFITYLNVYSNNVIKENDFQYVAIKDDEKQNVVKYGDVLFTLSSETPEEVGVGSVYLGKEKVYLNSFCFGIHITNTEVAFPPYLSYYVSLTAFRKFIYPYAQGSTRFNLCKADFEKASIKLPTLADQKRIYSILSHIDNKIITERQMLDLYNSQKQYLLRQMFI